eukprot:jgi/Bigna1/76408/fgenesh1_pg.41_\
MINPFAQVAAPLKRLYEEAERMGLKLIMHILRSQYGEGGVDVFGFGPMVVTIFTMFPLHMYTRTKTLEHFWTHPWADIQQRRRTTDGSYDAVPPEGAWGCLKSLSCVLAHFNTITSLPLDRISAYFGEKVAFYDAWLSFLAQWLCWPMFFGLALYAVQGGKFDIGHPAVPFYCLLLVGWAKLFVQYWRQRSAELAHGWGVLDYEQVSEVERPEFKGEKRINPLTGQEEKYYPAHKRLVAIGTTILLHILITGLCAYMMFLAFSSRDEYLENNVVILVCVQPAGRLRHQGRFCQIDVHGASGVSVELLLVPCVVGIVIPIVDFGYRYITNALTCWGELPGILVAGAFRGLLNLRAVLWTRSLMVGCIALQDAQGQVSSCAGFSDISLQSAARVGGRASSSAQATLRTIITPMVGQRCFACRMCCLKCFVKLEAFSRQLKPVDIQEIRELKKGDRGHGASISGRANTVSQAWIEAHLQIYDNFELIEFILYCEDNSHDESEFLTTDRGCLPTVPGLLLDDNHVRLRHLLLGELRFCAWKMCSFHQRPEALRAGGIGIWQHVLQWMTVIGLLTNVAIIGPTIVSWFPNLEVGQRVFLIFMFEHILLGLYYAAWHGFCFAVDSGEVPCIAGQDRARGAMSMKGRNPLAKPSHVFAASART